MSRKEQIKKCKNKLSKYKDINEKKYNEAECVNNVMIDLELNP